MAKFKIGDRVRRIKEGYIEAQIGQEFTVRAVTDNGWIKLEGFEGVNDRFKPDYFELVSPSGPIRTITKREIVPGTYGVVKIFHGATINDKSHMLFDMWRANPTPSELREAAELFKTVADVMEENDKE